MIMIDVELSMLLYYLIYYEKFKKVIQQTAKVALILHKDMVSYVSRLKYPTVLKLPSLFIN